MFFRPPSVLMKAIEEQQRRDVALAPLDKAQRQAVKDWMVKHGKPFDLAVHLVARENLFPPKEKAKK